MSDPIRYIARQATGDLASFVNSQCQSIQRAFEWLTKNPRTAGNVLNFGINVGNGGDDTQAFQACANYCGRTGALFFIPAGTYKISSPIVCAVGFSPLQANGPYAFNIQGEGREQTRIVPLSGAAAFLFQGSAAYRLCGSIRDVCIDGQLLSASGGLSFINCHQPLVERCIVRSIIGFGIKFDTCIMPSVVRSYITGCGSGATGTGTSISGEVEFFNCTTCRWDTSYISGGNGKTSFGLMLDQVSFFKATGGAIESAGVLIGIASRSAAIGCSGIDISCLDLENPTEAFGVGSAHYVESGYGLSGGAFVANNTISLIRASPSGATSIPNAIMLASTRDTRFRACDWSQAGTPTACYWIESSCSLITIDQCPSMFGLSAPYVVFNSVQRLDASPLYDWDLHSDPCQGLHSSSQGIFTGTNTTASVIISATQGGRYQSGVFNHSAPTTVATLTGGQRGAILRMQAINSNTTLPHSTTIADKFWLKGAVNLNVLQGQVMTFIHNGTLWVEQ
jgi:hypothetical protein